jgi:uncharacterized protein (DUF983 family)
MVHADFALERPPTGLLLRRGALLKCPQCGSGHLFGWWLVMKDDCPRCDLHFERIEGHWIGAIAMNTVLSLLVLLGVIVGGFTASYPDRPPTALLVVCLLIGGVGPLFFHPFSRTLWMAIDLAMRPVTADEIS